VFSKALVDWEKDLPGAWRIILDGIQLNFEDRSFDCPTHPGEIIIPRRKRIAAPDSSQNAHIFCGYANGRPKRCRGHFRLWEPLLYRILSFVAERRTNHVVFLLWGKHANRVFERGGIRATAKQAGTWGARLGVIRHAHPAAITLTGPGFLRLPNPFSSANKLLKQMGTRPIAW